MIENQKIRPAQVIGPLGKYAYRVFQLLHRQVCE